MKKKKKLFDFREDGTLYRIRKENGKYLAEASPATVVDEDNGFVSASTVGNWIPAKVDDDRTLLLIDNESIIDETGLKRLNNGCQYCYYLKFRNVLGHTFMSHVLDINGHFEESKSFEGYKGPFITSVVIILWTIFCAWLFFKA